MSASGGGALAGAATLTLRREGSALRTETGGPVIWVLHLTSNPQGYCWGRADKPAGYCERQQVRCGDPAPTS